MYRSNRFGDRYRQVWDVSDDEFSAVENNVMRFIGKHRSKKDYRIKGKTVGHVDIEMIKKELGYESEEIQSAVERLLEDEWLRKDEVDGRIGYDLNTNSGVRPRYMRLQPDSQSNTILTTDFNRGIRLIRLRTEGSLFVREHGYSHSLIPSNLKGVFRV